MKALNIVVILTALSVACASPEVGVQQEKHKPSQTQKLDLQSLLDQKKLEGSMLIYDFNQQDSFVFNSEDFNTPKTPASTFKILNSLIGLETGVIKDQNFVLKWDKVKRWNNKWNEDHDLETAYKNSTVWYYQELARRVGGKDMKYWLDKVAYGNSDTTGGIDKFWLTGGLRITISQQIDFLKQLHQNKLPFSQRNIDIVKEIMIAEETPTFVIRAKTGWGKEGQTDIGWYIGYVTTKNNVFYFASCVRNKQESDSSFYQDRIDIAREGLKQAGAIN